MVHGMDWRGIARPGMRGYYVPFVAGIVLAASAFLPWVSIGGNSIAGVPQMQGFWIVGLGVFAAVLAVLSLITRKNSRHPLLVVGLAALAILVLAWLIWPASAAEQALTTAQAFAIVENHPIDAAPNASVGSGIYLGIAAAAVIVGFGLTIVIRRAGSPYVVESADDDL
jgi:hypothetical protein